MDRAATREQSQRPRADSDVDVTPRAVGLGTVEWRGDSRIIRELSEFVSAARSARGITDRNALDRAPQAEKTVTVKAGPHRSVLRIELPSGLFFLKHFKALRWWHVLRNTLLGTPAERESQAARVVAAAGIETIHCAAVGTESRGWLTRDSFLATAAVPDVRPLDELVRDPAHSHVRTPAFRRELAQRLGRLCGRVHRAGLVHRDLHPGNLLAAVHPQGRIRLTLIDLQGVRRRSTWGLVFRRSARARWDLFGLFNFFQNASRSDRCRFLRNYLSEARFQGLGRAVRENHGARLRLARNIETFCRRSLRHEQIRYDKKWQRTNRRLIVADSRRLCCRGLALVGTDQVLGIRANPESLFRPERIRFWLRRTAFERAAIVDIWAAGEAIRCEARETIRPLGWRDLLPRFRWSSARRAWEMTHALRRRGILAPRALLYLETRSVSQVRELLVTERSGRSLPLTVFLAHHFPSFSPRQKEAWIKAHTRALATELGRMREFSLIHRRLNASHVLVSLGTTDCRLQIGGTDRVCRMRRLSQRNLSRMLGQLDSSLKTNLALRRVHRLRFLKTYLRERFRADWKPLWRAIERMHPPGDQLRALPPVAPVTTRTARAAMILFAISMALCGCQAVDRPITLPVRHQVKCEQLLVLSDFKLQKDHELIRELSNLREQEARLLELPLQRDPVVVYLFNNETEYRKYMATTFPKLPPRSAYFVGTPTELAVYTHWGQSVREDLRHEYTHGLLHSAMKRVPLWLDEGLAEYCEVSGPQPGGINREYATKLSTLLAQGWQPNLKRLESLDDNAQMRRADYQEAWAWVHFMLHGSPEGKRVLLSYLKDLRTIPDPKPISRRLASECPDFQERSMAYMSHLATERQVADAF
jgi:hypothetical protein